MARTPLGVLGDFLLCLRWHSIEVLKVLGWEFRQALVNVTKKDCLSIFPHVSCILFSLPCICLGWLWEKPFLYNIEVSNQLVHGWTIVGCIEKEL